MDHPITSPQQIKNPIISPQQMEERKERIKKKLRILWVSYAAFVILFYLLLKYIFDSITLPVALVIIWFPLSCVAFVIVRDASRSIKGMRTQRTALNAQTRDSWLDPSVQTDPTIPGTIAFNMDLDEAQEQERQYDEKIHEEMSEYHKYPFN